MEKAEGRERSKGTRRTDEDSYDGGFERWRNSRGGERDDVWRDWKKMRKGKANKDASVQSSRDVEKKYYNSPGPKQIPVRTTVAVSAERSPTCQRTVKKDMTRVRKPIEASRSPR